MSLGEFSIIAYNNMSYFFITRNCDVEGLKQVHEVSKHLQAPFLKTCDMSTDSARVWYEHAYILYNFITT